MSLFQDVTLPEFQQLNRTKQLETIKRDGLFLVHRQEVEADIVLYQVQSFYAEIYFSSDKSGTITHLASFAGEELPDLYINSIDLSEIEERLK